jgi:uncharacterized protein YdgA (DUF945 family)
VRKLLSAIILVLFLVVGLWGGATYWFGIKTEQQYKVLLQQASQLEYLKFVNESYSRGFFEAKARTIVELQLPAGTAVENQPIQVTLAQDISHGPFPFGKPADEKGKFRPVMAIIETRIMFSPETQDRLAEFLTQVPEIASMRDYTTIYLDGSGEERLLIPAFQRTFGKEDKINVDWKGLSFQVSFRGDLKGFNGFLSAPGSAFSAKDFDFKIEGVQSAFKTHEGLSGLWLGEASFNLSRLAFTAKQEPKPQAMLIRGFSASTSSTASGDIVNSLIAIRAEELELAERHYGPGVFEMEFRNLDAASLTKLQQAVREQQTQPRQKSAEAEMLARYTEILSGLLKKSPEIEVKQLDVKTTLGNFTGKARIAFDGTQSDSPLNLLTLAGALTAQVEFVVGERVLRDVVKEMMSAQIIADFQEMEGTAPSDTEINEIASARVDEQLETLMAQGILVEENGNYKSSASYQAGQIILNGRPLSLQDLLQ